MQNYYTPLPLYFKEHVPVENQDAILKHCDDILATIKDQHGLEIGPAKTSYEQSNRVGDNLKILNTDLFTYLMPKVWEAISYVSKEWMLEYNAYHITQCWTNRHYPGGKTKFHKHGATTQMVIAYYLNVPENGGNLLIKDPMEYHWAGYNSNKSDLNNQEGWVVPVQTGDMVVMPNFLTHGSEENTGTDARYVLTFNIMGTMGGENQ